MLDKEVVTDNVALEKDLPCELAGLDITADEDVVEEGTLCIGPCPTEFVPDRKVCAIF